MKETLLGIAGTIVGFALLALLILGSAFFFGGPV